MADAAEPAGRAVNSDYPSYAKEQDALTAFLKEYRTPSLSKTALGPLKVSDGGGHAVRRSDGER